MKTDIVELRTNTALLNALNEALSRKQTPQERLEQRVSFVYGSLNSENSVTRDKVREIITEQDGAAA